MSVLSFHPVRSWTLASLLAFSFAACNGGGDPTVNPGGSGGSGGSAGEGGTGGSAGEGGTGGSAGEGGTGGSAGEGGTDGSAGQGGTGGSAGQGGTGGSAGEGGSGGGDPSQCHDDADCAGLAVGQCAVSVCNDGSHEGPIGSCVDVLVEVGTECDDGLFCTVGDVCNEVGECVGKLPNDCGLEATDCSEVSCDELSASCSLVPFADGTSCESGDLCEIAACQAGECVVTPKDCSAMGSACTAGICDPVDGSCGAEPLDMGTSCDLAGLGQCEVAACDGAGSCLAEPLDAGTSCSLAGLGQCQFAACDGAGACEAEARPAGTACSLGGLGQCQTAACDSAGACAAQNVSDGTACNDGDRCTFADACMAGSCAGTYDGPACMAAATLYLEGFEDCASSGWTLAGEWECGTPTSGPNQARTGTGVVATKLAGTYGNNASFATSTATSPVIDLSGASSPVLAFWVWMHTEGNSPYDGFNVKVRRAGETGFTLADDVSPSYRGVIDSQPAWVGYDRNFGWRRFAVNLSAFAGDSIEVQFGFRSDGSGAYDGVFIDDLSVAEDVADSVAILPNGLPRATVGHSFAANLNRAGGSNAVSWSIVGGANHDWIAIDSSTGVLSGVPSVSNVGPVSVTVRVEDGILSLNSAEATLTTSVEDPGALLLYRSDLEGDCSSWTLGGDWECGTPTKVGPPGALSGETCLATRLSSDYSSSQNYDTATATSPLIDLTQASHPLLRFWAWVRTESSGTSYYDAFNVKVSTNGTSFSLLTAVDPPYTGTVNSEQAWSGDLVAFGWREYQADLSEYAGQSVSLRFAFRSDSSGNLEGVYIDDISIVEAAANPVSIATPVLPDGTSGRRYLASMRKIGGSNESSWSIVGGSNHEWLSIDAATGALSGTPATSNEGPVHLQVRVEEPLNPSNFAVAEYDFEVRAPIPGVYLDESFVNCAAWTMSSDWQCGEPSNVGPAACHSPGGCIATNMSGDYTNNMAWASAIATSPVIDLTDATDPKFTFWAWIRTESGNDAFNVKISRNGGPFTVPTSAQVSPAYYTSLIASENGWSGDLSSWRPYAIDISSYTGSTIQVRLAFRSDGSLVYPGVYVDDLSVTERYRDPLSITTSPNLGRTFVDQPFVAVLARTGGSREATWSLVDAPAWMEINPATGVVSGTPTASEIGPHTFTARVEEPQFPENFAEVEFQVVVAELGAGQYADTDFDASPSGWTLRGEWEWGTPSSVGPSSCHSGSGCIATRIASNYGNDAAYDTSTADSPPIVLAGATEPMVVSFWAWSHTEAGYDGFNLKVSNDGGVTYVPVTDVSPVYDGTVDSQQAWSGNKSASGWQKIRARLPASYTGETIRLRFAFRSDGSSNYAGVYIDDVMVQQESTDPLEIVTTRLNNGLPGIPWMGRLAKSGGSTASTWSLVSGPSWMQIDPQTGLLSGTPPALATHSVTVRVSEPATPANFAEATFSLDILSPPTEPYYEADFTSDGGWTVAGEWQRGVPTSGPGACRSGGECLATRLAGNYGNDATWAGSIATSPTIDLSQTVEPLVTFWAWVKTEGPNWDAFNLKISRDGGPFELPAAAQVSPGYTGSPDGQLGWGGDLTPWRRYVVDISAYAGSTIQLRFAFRSDGGGTDAGVYIDDLAISTAGMNPLSIEGNLPAVVSVGMPLVATFERDGGSSAAQWTFTPLQNASWLTFDPIRQAISGTPTAADVGPVSFMLRLEEPAFPSNFAEESFEFEVVSLPPGVAFSDDFEGPASWTLRGDWELGTPSNVGPASCHSGSTCLATKLSQNASPSMSITGNYVESPPMMVPAGAPSKLAFWAWIETSNARLNWFQAQILGDSYEVPAAAAVSPAYVNSSNSGAWGGDLSQLGWRKYSIDLSAYAGQTIRVAFILSTSSGYIGAGAYVDDVTIEWADQVGPSIVEDMLASAYVGVPYTQRMFRTVGPAAVTWSIAGGVNHTWLTIDPTTGVLTGTPGLGDIGPVSVVVRAEDPNDPDAADERELVFEVSGAEVYFATGFEGACPNDWVLTGDWECGTPSSVGPATAFGGNQCIATKIAGNYSNDRTYAGSNATSPDIDLTSAISPVLWFRMWTYTEGSTYDGANVKVSASGGTFALLADPDPAYVFTIKSERAWGGEHSGSGWRLVRVDLSDYVGEVVRLQFGNASDGSGVYPGVYIDDLVVVEAD
ncbi:Flagellar basal-body rod modification protein FlgD [Vulgatibacter incomptus]|uniref:Flagellar basal-body rod modification protein FlgD n=1 Tax=Vulgatibacter incomptus TaxID=1391653 RepID=A0A0K1P7Z5_9BACT|nr:Flagellar basal-body rod modification protein FlgD [Vulgatibacter incomptus]